MDSVIRTALTRNDFQAFFADLHEGREPFPWQQRLLTTVLDDGWPTALMAPTGTGKTSVIDVHVFALAVAAASQSALPPRRLAMIVDRRVLVDDQYRYARSLAWKLATAYRDSVLGRVAAALWAVQGGHDSQAACQESEAAPLLVAQLRGGLPPSRRWPDHPTAAAVLCATPEMFGSRLLFGGYGSSPLAWPREAGLLAIDTVAVVDEAHLARQLLRTARRVGVLGTVAERPWQGPAPLQVVETTATPGEQVRGSVVGVNDNDLDDSALLRRRVTRPKPVALVQVAGFMDRKPPGSLITELTRRIVALQEESQGTVGCFVNTVARAAAVAQKLRKIPGRSLRVVLVCGQIRPYDLDHLEQCYPGVLTTQGHSEVDVLISTQSLEVGVDLDLCGIVTELASGTALAQRVGRVNRCGEREYGRVIVLVPGSVIDDDKRSGPYRSEELREARAWLDRRAADPAGLASWAMRDDPPPTSQLRRQLLQRPELGQVWHWARTSDTLNIDPELDLWLSDDLDLESAVGIVVRRDLPEDTADATELITLLRPRAHETFSLPIATARRALDAACRTLRQFRVLVVRGDEVRALLWTTEKETPVVQVRPGDVLVVDATTPMFTDPAVGDGHTPPVPSDEPAGHTTDDVLEGLASLDRDLRPGEVVHRIDLPVQPDHDQEPGRTNYRELVTLLTVPEDELDAVIDPRPVVRDWLDTHAETPMAHAAAKLLHGPSRDANVVVQHDNDGLPIRVLVIDRRRAQADEYIRQEWTRSDASVQLADHQSAVAERVGYLAELLGLPKDLICVLREAALHHDDGKADSRFQRRLRARSGEILAKSAHPSSLGRLSDLSGLPPRWRHEQRSVVDAWPAISGEDDRALIVRLIGTSHGHGRTDFPHTSQELLAEGDTGEVRDTAVWLFDEGGWDELIERTERRYGVWVCAYLEAVLRAADGQISGEGR